MKQLPITQVGNELIRASCTPYTIKEITSYDIVKLLSKMKYTLQKVHGVGLAAPQVGIQKQLFILRLFPTKYRPELPKIKTYAVFNPKIIKVGSNTNIDYEGCFSVANAGLFAKLVRPTNITVSYFNEIGKQVTKELEGIEARIFLHEFDHLLGKVFLDHSPDVKTFMSANEYKLMRAKKTGNSTT